jgi:ribosomal protein S18 acetylase RimI-like enzyme
VSTARRTHDAPALVLRAAKAADLPSVRALATQVFLDTYATEGVRASLAREAEHQFSIEALAAVLERAHSRIVVAERAGHLVAFAEHDLAARHPLVGPAPAAELVRLYVQPAFQRQGIGRRLLADAERSAGDAGCATLWLTAWVGNARALAFYRRHGYRELGTTLYEFEGERYENRLFARPLGGSDLAPGAR